MSKLRRYYKHGNIYFITSITFNRNKILIDNIDLFKDAIRSVHANTAFKLIAWVVLPDHFHIIINPKTSSPSKIIQKIKMSFTMRYFKQTGKKCGRVWQYRFWDHILKDENDMNNHINYIHYNPVKHNLVESPFKWQHSSFRKYYDDGLYENNWGIKDTINFNGDYGE